MKKPGVTVKGTYEWTLWLTYPPKNHASGAAKEANYILVGIKIAFKHMSQEMPHIYDARSTQGRVSTAGLVSPDKETHRPAGDLCQIQKVLSAKRGAKPSNYLQ